MNEPKYYTPESVEELITYFINEGKIWGVIKDCPGELLTIDINPNKITNLDLFIQYNNMSKDPEETRIYTIDKDIYRIKYLDEEDFNNLNLKLIKDSLSSEETYLIMDKNHLIGNFYPTRNEQNMYLYNKDILTIKNIFELRQVLKLLK